MAINPVRVVTPPREQREPKKRELTDIEKIMQGLQIVQVGFGIASDFTKIKNAVPESEALINQRNAQTAKTKAETAQIGKTQTPRFELKPTSGGGFSAVKLDPFTGEIFEGGKIAAPKKPIKTESAVVELPGGGERKELFYVDDNGRRVITDSFETKPGFDKLSPQQKLQSLSPSDRDKVALTGSALIAIDRMEEALKKGSAATSSKELLADVPIFGRTLANQFGTQNPATAQAAIFTEMFGRLQSGGAIGVEEGASFRALLPTPEDSEEIRALKFANLREALEAKLKVRGLTNQDLQQVLGSGSGQNLGPVRDQNEPGFTPPKSESDPGALFQNYLGQ